MSNKCIVELKDQRVLIREETNIRIYSSNGRSYVEHKLKKIPINSEFNFSKLKDGMAPIQIKYKEKSIININNRNFSNCDLILKNYSRKISPGERLDMKLNEGDKLVFLIRNKENKKIQLSLEYRDNLDINNSEEKIINNISDIYDESSKIIESETNSSNVYHDILEIIQDIDRMKNITGCGSGQRRKVYRIEESDALKLSNSYINHIIKIARNESGIKSNKREFQTWQAVKGTELEKYFCPIVYRGPNYRYVIMKEADILGYDNNLNNKKIRNIERDIYSDITKYIKNDDIEETNQSLDISADNIGLYNGRYVLVDYPYGAKFNKK